MRCIDFDDHEPPMDIADGATLATCPFFKVESFDLTAGTRVGNPDPDRFSIVTIVSGAVESDDGRTHAAGDFLLMPCGSSPLTAQNDASILQTTIPR